MSGMPMVAGCSYQWLSLLWFCPFNFLFFKTKRWIRSSGALLSAELCWVRPRGSFSCLLFVTVAKVKRALGGNVTHFIIALHLNALRLVVNMAKGGSETHVSLLRVISKQTLAMKRYHESQQRAFRVPPRSSGKDRGHWPWRRSSRMCWVWEGASREALEKVRSFPSSLCDVSF